MNWGSHDYESLPGGIYESSRFPVLKSQKVGDCFIRVTLDTRHASREGKLPVAICFHQQGKKWYYHLDMKLTGDEFVNVCKSTGRGRVSSNFAGDKPYDIKLKLEAEFDKYYSMVESLSRSKRLTIPAIKTMITGVGDDISFLKILGKPGKMPEKISGESGV